MSHVDLGYDMGKGVCVISVDSDLVFEEGFDITAFGSEYENADTMFALWVGDERVETRRPEPLLVDFLSDIVADCEIIIKGETKSRRVSLDKAQQVKLAKVAREIERNLKNSPLGGTK